MITNEAGLEAWICDNQDEFIAALRYSFDVPMEYKIHFVGRQITIGKENRLDLLYYFDFPTDKRREGKDDGYVRAFIVVELKFRELKVSDLAQLGRYMNAIECTDGLQDEQTAWRITTCGVLVGDGVESDLDKIVDTHLLNRRRFAILDVSENLSFDYYDPFNDDAPETADKRFIKALIAPWEKEEVEDEPERIPEDSQETKE